MWRGWTCSAVCGCLAAHLCCFSGCCLSLTAAYARPIAPSIILHLRHMFLVSSYFWNSERDLKACSSVLCKWREHLDLSYSTKNQKYKKKRIQFCLFRADVPSVFISRIMTGRRDCVILRKFKVKVLKTPSKNGLLLSQALNFERKKMWKNLVKFFNLRKKEKKLLSPFTKRVLLLAVGV